MLNDLVSPSLSLSDVYAVIDLYGQCVQVSITSSSGPLDNSLCTSNVTEKSFPIQSPGTPLVFRTVFFVLMCSDFCWFLLLCVCSSRSCSPASQ